MNEVSLYVAAASAFWFAGISVHGRTIAIIQSCSSCKSCQDLRGQRDVVCGFAVVGSDCAAEDLF